MSAERIIMAAFARFAAQGYDAASMAQIASDAGIRKPSIYAHFKSKETLFLHLMENAFSCESECLGRLAQGVLNPDKALKQYLLETISRYDANPRLRFWLRAIYLPPTGLEAEIGAYDNGFARLLENSLDCLFRQDLCLAGAMDARVLTGAFIGMLRGVHAELLYKGRAHAEKIAAAMWSVYGLALQKSDLEKDQK